MRSRLSSGVHLVCYHLSKVFEFLLKPDQDIIILLILGVLFVVLFVLWQRYLESIQDLEKPKYSIWTPPPLMRVSLWGRARGRFAATMAIAFLTWCAFLSWNFWIQVRTLVKSSKLWLSKTRSIRQLFYQNFMKFTPLQTVVRLLPMFVCGITCNVFVAFVVGRVPIVYFIGKPFHF